MLKFHKVLVVPVVGHYDGDLLVNEEVGEQQQGIYTEEQFKDYLAAIRAEIDQRNLQD